MKKLFIILFVAMASLTTLSCSKLDKRDQFVGDYSLKVHGEIAFENGTQKTVDWDNLRLTVAKAPGNFKLNISGFYTCEATVVGEIIVMDDIHITEQTDNGITSNIVVQGSNGMFIDNTLTFVNNINGYVNNGMRFDGWFSNEAVKIE